MLDTLFTSNMLNKGIVYEIIWYIYIYKWYIVVYNILGRLRYDDWLDDDDWLVLWKFPFAFLNIPGVMFIFLMS
jgi:hypothetical protein